jgi:hypothetical protein
MNKAYPELSQALAQLLELMDAEGHREGTRYLRQQLMAAFEFSG